MTTGGCFCGALHYEYTGEPAMNVSSPQPFHPVRLLRSFANIPSPPGHLSLSHLPKALRQHLHDQHLRSLKRLPRHIRHAEDVQLDT
jgi:hypothetical protein